MQRVAKREVATMESLLQRAKMRSFPILILLVTISFAMVYQYYLHRWWTGIPGKWAYGDLVILSEQSATAWNGPGIEHIYTGQGYLLIAFPGFIYGMGIATWIAHLCGMVAPMGTLYGFHHQLYILPQGASWNLIIPLSAAVGLVPIVAADSLLRDLGADRWSRYLGTVVCAVLLWWISIYWGHPDDAIAVGLLLWGASSIFRGSSRRGYWYIGFGLCCQPLIALAIPILLAITAWRKWGGAIARMLLPSIIVLLPPFIGSPGATFRQIVLQPAMTPFKTPWLSLAPHVPKTVFSAYGSYEVSGGSVRAVSVLAALGLGIWTAISVRRHGPYERAYVVWLMGVALSFRVLVEPVLLPYYVVPVLAILMISASSRGVWRSLLYSACAVIQICAVSFYSAPWPYWCCLLATTTCCVLAARPTSRSSAEDKLIEGDVKELIGAG